VCGASFPLAYAGIRTGRALFGLVCPGSLLLDKKDGTVIFAHYFPMLAYEPYNRSKRKREHVINAWYSIKFLYNRQLSKGIFYFDIQLLISPI